MICTIPSQYPGERRFRLYVTSMLLSIRFISPRQQENCASPSSKRQKSVSRDPNSDTECISQEDLLAQLGLNSVKKLKAEEANAKRVVHPEPPKRSILEFLSCPVVRWPADPSVKVQLRKEKPLTNGCADKTEDGSGDDELSGKEEVIVQLQNNLRNEEAKLLLLRKLYACQNDKGQKEATISGAARTAAVTTAANTQAQQSAAAAGQRKSIQVPNAQKPHQSVHSSTVQPRVVFLSQPRGQPINIAPKLVAAAGKSQDAAREAAQQRNVRPLQVSVGQNSSSTKSVASTSTGSSKVIQRPQAVHPTAVFPQGSVANKSSAPRGVTSAHDNVRPVENGVPKSISVLNIIPSHSVQQSRSDAKLTLRKQLERTLLQIPLPKPPVQDWNFVPSVNTQDFTILIGLEGVVNHIVESKELSTNSPVDKKPAPVSIPPQFCSQCDTDFTPAWRKKPLEDDTNSVTLCESCYTQKIKKTLKTEHTARLKAEFVKALKQEQEVEQKYQSSAAVTSKQSKTDAAKSQTLVRSGTHSQIRQPHARIVYHPTAGHTSLQLQAYPQHHSIVHQLQQQQLQQQELEAAHHQDTRYFAYVGQHNCQPQHKQRHSYSGENDRQREYLLDMIPSGHTNRGYRI